MGERVYIRSVGDHCFSGPGNNPGSRRGGVRNRSSRKNAFRSALSLRDPDHGGLISVNRESLRPLFSRVSLRKGGGREGETRYSKRDDKQSGDPITSFGKLIVNENLDIDKLSVGKKSNFFRTISIFLI